MPVISLRGVEKSYNRRALFTDVDLDVAPGTAVGIQGENGSGKSVLLKIITQFVRPDAGTARIDDAYLSPNRVFPQGFGVLIDRPGYIPSQTGLENLLALAGIRKVVDERKVRDTMTLLGLDPGLPQKARHYSLGMKQRLGLAQAIMEDQPVLILDEPFNGLDEDTVVEFRQLFRTMVDDGRTLIMTSHQQDDIDAICDHPHRLRRGRLERNA
ncbi:ABC transporter ATP-binding protein [Occultella gossypii]|uniref:ABC transporter ATP-binding protein n=1 Tax=Occultella gossypii TaxID=2800820 RepID=A0ABS7SHS1_9MICO|nr:ABC transporter ATP-binding protein [Occultella gossypii]MBZ2199715.1 ABC transporter ATP-binding protein [Occultella gossypii]